MASFGTSPFGISPFGPGTPASAAAPPDAAPLGAKFLDPRTRDFSRDAQGVHTRMPRNRQRVVLALTTLRGSSSALFAEGVELPRKMGESFERRAGVEVRRALRALTEAGAIHVDAVAVLRDSQGAQITVSYTDLEDGTGDSVTV